MREIRHPHFDVEAYLEEALRAKQQQDVERWRSELRPRAMRLFASRTANLTWSRALVKLLVDELYPDDLFALLVSDVDRVPRRHWPRVIAIALALRHSWRQDGLARIARRLHISLASTPKRRRTSKRSRPSPRGLSGSSRPRQGSSLRSDPAKRGSRP